MEKNGTLASPAMALARSVLPVPGGPTRSTPLGIFPPSFWNLGGSFRNSMISRSSSLASSTPATSWNVTLFCFSEMRRARALPNDSALAPPPCIWRMKKIHTPMNSSIGTHCRRIAYHGFVSGGLTSIFTPRSRRDFTRSGYSAVKVLNAEPSLSRPVTELPRRVTSLTSPASTFLRKSEKTISPRGDWLAWKRLKRRMTMRPITIQRARFL